MARSIRLAAVVTAVLTVGALGLWGTASAQSPQARPKRQVLTIGTTNELDSLNPFVAVESPAYETFFLNYDLLNRFSQKDMSPAPGLAETWEHSEDGKTWTYHVRSGVKWSDGQPFTARDVAYTYNRVLKEQSGTYIGYLPFVKSVTAPDDNTVVITTTKPVVFMQGIWIPILPEHIWKDISAKEAKTFDNEDPVGTGPFHVVEWKKGQFWRMEANKSYWGGAPHIDEVIFRVFNNADAMVQALKKGEIDAAEAIQPSLVRSLQGDKNISIVEAGGFGWTHIGFNAGSPEGDGNPALRDVRVRQAIYHAVDKETLLNKVNLGYGQLADTIVPPGLALYHLDVPADQEMAFDIQRSRDLLAEAGYRDTNGNGIVDKGGKDLELRYFVRSERADSSKEAQFIKGWLKQAGIQANVKALTDTKLTDVIYAGDYDIFSWGWGSDPDPDFILSVVTCEQWGSWSDTFYCNKEYDRMYQEQKTLLDPAQRAQVVKQMQQMVYEDAPYVPLYYDVDIQAYRNDRYTGWVRQPDREGGSIFFAYGPYSYVNVRPVSAQRTQAGSGGISTGVWVALAAALIAIAAAVMLFRRRVGAEERE